MRLAIMQPYFFPYIGYFQLAHAADKMILYDLVTYRKLTWINRNRLLNKSSGKVQYIIAPVHRFRLNTLIKEIRINHSEDWAHQINKFIYYNYKRTPYFDQVYPLVQQLITLKTDSIHEFNYNSFKGICDFLEISTEIHWRNDKFLDMESRLQSDSSKKNIEPKSLRIIEICKKESAAEYVNPIDGQQLYDRTTFQKEGLSLSFIKSAPIEYPHFAKPFPPGLSIIDMLMHCGKDGTSEHISNYSLI